MIVRVERDRSLRVSPMREGARRGESFYINADRCTATTMIRTLMKVDPEPPGSTTYRASGY